MEEKSDLEGGRMQKGYRTKSREDIIGYIERNKERRFSASDVYQYLKERESTINLTTVYRNLEKLTENKVLMRLGYGRDGSELYQYLIPESGCHEHLHIQCNVCGKVFHAEEDFMESVNAYFMKNGYDLISGESVLIGICEECKSEKRRIQ